MRRSSIQPRDVERRAGGAGGANHGTNANYFHNYRSSSQPRARGPADALEPLQRIEARGRRREALGALMPAYSHVPGFPRRSAPRLRRRPLSLVVGARFAPQFSKVRLVGFLKIFLIPLEIFPPCSWLPLGGNPTVAAANDPDDATYTRNEEGDDEDAERQGRD